MACTLIAHSVQWMQFSKTLIKFLSKNLQKIDQYIDVVQSKFKFTENQGKKVFKWNNVQIK